MSHARKLTLLATVAWLVCFFLLVRLFAVSGPNEYRTVQAVVAVVLLVVAGWLTGKAVVARRLGR